MLFRSRSLATDKRKGANCLLHPFGISETSHVLLISHFSYPLSYLLALAGTARCLSSSPPRLPLDEPSLVRLLLSDSIRLLLRFRFIPASFLSRRHLSRCRIA
jgi:hypothetical protein